MKKVSKGDPERKSFVDIIKSFQEIYEDVANETYLKSKQEVLVLFEMLRSWVNVNLFSKYGSKEIIHSVQGVLFSYFWRATGWIIYEIITGHYFEALRDLRFMFEGSLLALHYDCLIDNRLYERWGYLGKFDLKAEIVELAERLREKLRTFRKGSLEELNDIVRDKVEAFVNESNVSQQEKEWYIETYTDILSQPMFYWSIPKIISEFVKEWGLEEYEDDLKRAWAVLSLYTHFSRKFFEWVLHTKPLEVFIEDYNEHLFKICYSIFITTIDIFLSTLLVRYQKLQDIIKQLISDWETRLSVNLNITKKMLKNLKSKE